MELKQADIFGGYKLIVKKAPKKVPKQKNKQIKEKIQTLYNLYEQLYKQMDIEILEQRDFIVKIKNGIIIYVYPEERQAEPMELANFGIYDIDKKIERMRELCENK